MDTSQVLESLQHMYAGQLVLYVDDIAKALRKSEKATLHLIQRGGLPFPVKKLGGQWCVDIFHFAQWLASSKEAAEEVVGQKRPETKQGSKGNRVTAQSNAHDVSQTLTSLSPVPASVRRPKKSPLSGQASASETASPFDLSAQLIEMRQAYAPRLARHLATITDPDSAGFLLDLIERLAAADAEPQDSYAVRVKSRSTTENGFLEEQSNHHFAELTDAVAHLRHNFEALSYTEGVELVDCRIECGGLLLAAYLARPGLFQECYDPDGILQTA